MSVQSTMVSAPAFAIPPAFEIVKPERKFFVPGPKENTRKVPGLLTVKDVAPGPRILTSFITSGKEADRIMEPLTFENVMSPPPLVFASRIACRNEPGPESEVLVTRKRR